MDELISIVVPMYLEENVAEECYKRITAIAEKSGLRYELIFVNDGSTDRTMEILERLADRDKRVKVISFSRNFGHQIAVTAGIERAKGDAVVIMDADLQDPPELIPEMIKLWKKGYEVVYAKRKKREGETWFKLLTAKLFYEVLDKTASIKIPLDTGDFRLIDRKAAEAFKKMPERNRFVRGMMSWVGFRQIPIEYEREERFAGKTKYPFRKMLKLAFDGIFSFSSKPLKFVEYLGLWTVLLALAVILYSMVCKISGMGSPVTGWTSIMTTVTFFGGVQMLSVGIVGEYVARIYDESKGRPLFIIDKEVNMEERDTTDFTENKKEDGTKQAVS
ncbi:MAG: glycosyltransferase family 2 protein [Clostridiales bacterium]|jgi:dolichol-phosphate mannosyltransferase|nr:glycosyltransferase family 2 protein [Eubacteriales bacterium]MDH7566576.1 glycosyltransferase family 2 protein [Clostridiales bacterium]